MGKGKFDSEARRGEILDESMSKANEPRYGYFGYTSPLAIGENSKAPRTKKFAEDDFKKPNMLCAGTKKGNTVDTLFGWATPLCCGDPYVGNRQRREKVVMLDPENKFRPAGAVKHNSSKGIEYKCVPDPKAKREKRDFEARPALPNVLTTVTKRGGGGTYTPGVLFGMDEERKFPPYVPQGDGKRGNKEKFVPTPTIHEMSFKGPGYGNQPFLDDKESYYCDKPYGIPREERVVEVKIAQHEAPFKAAGTIKEGLTAYCGFIGKDPDKITQFPEWVPDPVPQPAKRKRNDDEKDQRESFKVGAPVHTMNPMPAVQMIRRNLRSEFPKSFMRPKI